MNDPRHFVLHKPPGYLSQLITNQTKRRNKKLLGALYDFPEGTMAIGRLDEDSEGLLLLTTDGKVSEQIRRKTVEKEYYAQVDGEITEQAVAQLAAGVSISINGKPYQTLACQARRLTKIPHTAPPLRKIRDDRHGPTSWVAIILTEGKNRQIRKMTAKVGFPTLRLIRVRIGQEQLGDLASGEVREVKNFQR